MSRFICASVKGVCAMHKIIAAAFILATTTAGQAKACDWNHEAAKAPEIAVATAEQTTQQPSATPDAATPTVATDENSAAPAPTMVGDEQTTSMKRMQCAVLDGPCGAQGGEPSFFVSPNRRDPDPDPVFPLGR
jgi:hypothetical protein